MKDLNEAILIVREALSLLPQGDPDQPMCSYNLAVYLFSRYNQLGAVEDLDKAIFCVREALDLLPQGHLVSQCLYTALQIISPLGTTGSGRRRTSTGLLFSSKKPPLVHDGRFWSRFGC